MPNCTLSVSPWTIETWLIGDAEPVGDELGEGGLVALAVAVRAGEHLDRADRVDPDLGRFPQADAGAERADRRRGRDAAGLDMAGEADAAAACRRPWPRSVAAAGKPLTSMQPPSPSSSEAA